MLLHHTSQRSQSVVDFTSSGEHDGDIRVERDDQRALRIARGVFVVTRSAEVVLGKHFICATSPNRCVLTLRSLHSPFARRASPSERSPNGPHRRAPCTLPRAVAATPIRR